MINYGYYNEGVCILKIHVTSNIELRDSIRNALKENDGYCPCVINSKGKEQYRCLCDDFVYNIPVGESCHCGLYIKDEN